jgi:hypothetical protein
MDEQERERARTRARAVRAEAAVERKRLGKRCPCCGDPVAEVPADQAALTFSTLRQNDVRELFRITGDLRLVFAEGVEPADAARIFAQAFTEAAQAGRPAADPT